MGYMRGVPQSPAALLNNTAADLTDPTGTQVGNADLRAIVRVAADHAFRLNVLAIDASGNWYLVKQVASAAVTVDGATAGYTSVAELSDIAWPAAGKAQIYNASGATLNWISDYRLYER